MGTTRHDTPTQKSLHCSLVSLVSVVVALAATLTLTACLATTGDPIANYDAPAKALIILDMQRDFVGDAPKMPVAGDAEAVIRATNDAIARARTENRQIIYVANAFSRGDFIGNWFRNDAAISGTSGAELDPRLARLAGDPIFHKSAPDAFTSADFDAYLRKQKINDIEFAGVFGDQCVYYSTRGALNRGYRVTLLREAIAGSSPEAVTEALSDLTSRGATTR